MRWTGGRHDTFEYQRLTRSGEIVGTLDNVLGGSIAENLNTSLKASGSLDLVGDVDLGDDRVRIILHAEEADDSADVVLGTFLASTPSRMHNDRDTTARLSLYSTLLVIDEDRLEETLSVATGSDIVAVARTLAVDAGVSAIALPSAYTNTTPLLFEAGRTKLDVVNALLEYAGYASATMNPLGVVVMAPYIVAASRALAWTFRDGDGSMFFPEVPIESDWYHTPNVVVVVPTNPSGALVPAKAENNDPACPLSTVTRGRRIVRHESISDAPNQAAVQAKANLLLATSSNNVTTGTIRHTYAPIALGDHVRLDYTRASLDHHMTVQSRDMELVPGLPTTTKVRRFDV
ncbi:MAG: hypothetical protein ACYCXZ_06605 [Coriobacteriia bacterium]